VKSCFSRYQAAHPAHGNLVIQKLRQKGKLRQHRAIDSYYNQQEHELPDKCDIAAGEKISSRKNRDSDSRSKYYLRIANKNGDLDTLIPQNDSG